MSAKKTKTGAPRKGRPRKGPVTIHITTEFIGLTDERGKVLVDDTSYFRIQREEQPIRDWLDADAHVRKCRDELQAAKDRGEKHTAHLEAWLEQAIISSFAAMLREVRKRG